jgi:D-amino peptidase
MMKVYVMTDLEGVAGVVSFETQTYPGGKRVEESGKLLTAEVNAAVDAMVDCGVDDILIEDGHGPGAIHYPDLHDAAKLLHGRPHGTRQVTEAIVETYDVMMMVGQHAMAGRATGNLSHSQSSRAIEYIKLNDRPIGEIAQCALYTGALGLPFIFLSGDEAGCREAEELVPGITTAAVKVGTGRNAAVSVSMAESHRRIREGVTRAIEKQASDPIPPLVWDPPFVMEKRFFHTDMADRYAQQNGYERVDDQTIRYRGDDIRDVIYR